MKKSLLIILIFAIIFVGCGIKHSKVCACYIFPTMSYNGHYYIEINDSGVMTVYCGQGSDIVYRSINNQEPLTIGVSSFISNKSYYSSINEDTSCVELKNVRPWKYSRNLSDKEYDKIASLLKKVKGKNTFYDGLDKDVIAAVLIVNGHTYSGYYTDNPKTFQDSLVKLIVKCSPIKSLYGFGGYIEYDHNIKREPMEK